MARWVFGCPDCNQEFTYSEVDTQHRQPFQDPLEWIGDKPKLPATGEKLQCPNCKRVSLYQRYQLIYRAS